MDTTRRSFLATGAGALAALAGCVGHWRPGSGSATGGGTNRSAADPNPFGASDGVGGFRVTPTDAHVQHTLLYLHTADSMRVLDPGGDQLLFVDLEVTPGNSAAPGPDEFRLEVGPEEYRGWTGYEGHRGHSLAPDDRRGQQYRPDEPAGWVGFALPDTLPSGDIWFTVDRESAPVWAVPASAREALDATAPDLSIRSVEVADATADDGTIPLSMTVDNAGGPGTCRFSVNYRGPSYAADPHRFDVGAGETRTLEANLEPFGSPSGRIELAIATAEDTYRRTVDAGGEGG